MNRQQPEMSTHLGRAGLSAVEGGGSLGPSIAGGSLDGKSCQGGEE